MSDVQVVTVNTVIASSGPSNTIAKVVNTSDLTITLPDASTVVGQQFTVKRDSTGGRSWAFTNTGNSTALNAGGLLNGCLTSDKAHYYQLSSCSDPTPTLYKMNTSSWAVEQSTTIASIGSDTITDLILSADGSQLYMVVSDSTASYVRVYLTSSFTLSSTITLTGSTSTGAACFSSDGTVLYVATNLGIISITLSTSTVATFVSNTGLSKQGICATASYVFVGNTSGSILAYTVSTGALAQTISSGTTGPIISLTYDSVNSKVWGIVGSTSNGSVLLVVDPVGLTLLYSAQFNFLYTNGNLLPPRLAIDTDNNYVYLGAARSVYIFDATVAGDIATLLMAVKGYQTSSTALATQWMPVGYLGNATILLKDNDNSANTAWFYLDGSETNGDNVVIIATQSEQLINGNATVTLHSPNDSITVVAYQDPVTGTYGWAALDKISNVNQDINVAALPKYQQQDFANELMVVQLTDGSLIGWGDNTGGALCNGQTAGVSPPAPVLYDPSNQPQPSATIVDWALTSYNLYVVFSDGTAYAGGQNASGQLGNGTTTNSIYLKQVQGLPINVNRVWAGVATSQEDANQGYVFFCTSDNTLYACGENGTGELGLGTTTNTSTPTLVTLPDGTINDVVIGLANGAHWTLINISGSLYATGVNSTGQLGLGNTTQQTTFQAVTIPGAGTINKIRTIGNYNGTTRWGSSMVLDSNGKIFTTGSNNVGQLGIGNTTQQSSFSPITPSTILGVTPTFVDCGWVNGLDPVGWAITAVGTFWTWGYGGSHATFETATTNKKSPGIPDSSGNPMQNVRKVTGAVVATNSNDAQLMTLCVDGEIKCGGVLNGMFGVSDAYITSTYVIPGPQQMPFPQNEIVQMFMHGSTSTQRLFVLTKKGKLFALGSNTNAIVTGGVEYSTTNTAGMWYQIGFGRYQR